MILRGYLLPNGSDKFLIMGVGGCFLEKFFDKLQKIGNNA